MGVFEEIKSGSRTHEKGDKGTPSETAGQLKEVTADQISVYRREVDHTNALCLLRRQPIPAGAGGAEDRRRRGKV